MSGSVTYTAWSQGGPELPSTNLLSLHSHPSLHRNANGIVSPVLLSCWAEDLACLSNFVLQSREPSTGRRARKLYTVVFTMVLPSVRKTLGFCHHRHRQYFVIAVSMSNMNSNFTNLFSQWVAAQAPGSSTSSPASGDPGTTAGVSTMASNPSSFPPAASSGGPPGATGTQLNQLGNQFFQFLHAQQASPADPNVSTSPASATNSSASP